MSGEANFGGLGDWKTLRDKSGRNDRIDSWLQIGIAVLSIVSMFLLAMLEPWNRWGYVVGLAGQPFWFIATWRAQQYGMLVVSTFYTAALVLGVVNHF